MRAEDGFFVVLRFRAAGAVPRRESRAHTYTKAVRGVLGMKGRQTPWLYHTPTLYRVGGVELVVTMWHWCEWLQS